MVLKSEDKGNSVIVRINSNKINYENANLFSKQTVELIETKLPRNLAIDFTSVKYISSIGISALSVIKAISKINGCNIALFGLAPEVTEVLDQTGVSSLFEIVPSEKEALEFFADSII